MDQPLVTLSSLTTLALVLAMAAAAPLLCAAISRYFRVPVPVMEMLLGIVIGPGALAIATNARLVSVLAAIGMWCLFYSAGYETDFSALRGKLLATASGAWVFCLLLGIGVGTLIASLLSGGYSGGVTTTPLVSGIFIGAALVSTGLGTLLPMMRDAGEITTRVGRATISSGIIGQFTPLVALAILVGVFSPPIALLTHILFFGIVASLAYLGKRGLPRFATRVQTNTLDTGGQFGVRMQIATCAIVVAFAYLLGVNLAIGSFGAGVLMRSFLAKVPFEEHLVLDRKIRGVINGVFLPVFFVNAGIAFDLPGLLAQPSAFALIPLFLVLMLVVRGIPGSATLPLARRRRRLSAETQKRPLVFNIPVRAAKARVMIDDDDDGVPVARLQPVPEDAAMPAGVAWRERVATSLLVGTGLAAVILMADLGLAAGAITSVTAAALMGAAKISALIFPTIALNLARQARERYQPAETPIAVDDR